MAPEVEERGRKMERRAFAILSSPLAPADKIPRLEIIARVYQRVKRMESTWSVLTSLCSRWREFIVPTVHYGKSDILCWLKEPADFDPQWLPLCSVNQAFSQGHCKWWILKLRYSAVWLSHVRPCITQKVKFATKLPRIVQIKWPLFNEIYVLETFLWWG